MATEELRIIVNPTAAHGAVGKEWPDIRSYLGSQGLAFREALTEAPGHATELAQEALQAGYGTVVAVGGDGTVNEVVNGLVNGGEIGYGRVPAISLAVISRGTGCDLVRTLGLRRMQDVAQALSRRQERIIDLGEIIFQKDGKRTRRLFANVAGLGFDGEVVEGLLERQNAGKEIGGTAPYLMQVVRSVMSYRNKTVRAHVDDLCFEGPHTAFFACNGRYFAGGMRVAPQADVADGLLDVVRLAPLSSLGLLLRLPTVYLGWHTAFREISVHRARELRVETEDRLLIEADGELIGQAPATMRIIPQALRIRV